MYKLAKHGELSIDFKVEFGEWSPGVGEDHEDAKEFRVYNDGVWEFLNKDGNPICQGVDAKVTYANREKPEHE